MKFQLIPARGRKQMCIRDRAYTMLDATGAVDARLSEKLSSIPAVIRVRIL